MMELGTRRTYRKGAGRKLSACRLCVSQFYPDPHFPMKGEFEMHAYRKITQRRIRWSKGTVFNILLSLLLLSVGTNAFAATQTFNPTGDTYVAAEIPDMKFCNEPTVAVGTHTDMLGYVKFNLSSIPSGSIINSAELRLWCIQIINNVPSSHLEC